MNFAPDKCKIIYITSKQKNILPPYNIHGKGHRRLKLRAQSPRLSLPLGQTLNCCTICLVKKKKIRFFPMDRGNLRGCIRSSNHLWERSGCNQQGQELLGQQLHEPVMELSKCQRIKEGKQHHCLLTKEHPFLSIFYHGQILQDDCETKVEYASTVWDTRKKEHRQSRSGAEESSSVRNKYS